ncbi:hypothetical protein ASU91_17735 [Enterobacter hormaechei subsp. steigerwaltii]|nr:hypothetical protein SS35_25465 [Enterobacter hormaechei subsp. steigerwaltii]OAR84356.1 hypothetical protein AYO01_05200 [Enterobacter hormaechei]KJL77450.1 hypothetical protein SS24_24745 [Enterobacter hormaechei subsp. steigerwaltii]KJL78303.1 hypothetical protein SS61_24850 [Enterobacter hormaechei subsp. steigerwaltii]KJW76749.1 hypothetical protein SG68_25080 [Enterobacter hormaechei subsp. steigerwaltii]
MKVINSHQQFSIVHNWKHTPPANKPIPISERVECASMLQTTFLRGLSKFSQCFTHLLANVSASPFATNKQFFSVRKVVE